MSEVKLPDDHEFEFTATVWSRPGDHTKPKSDTNPDKPVSFIMRQLNWMPLDDEDVFVEIPFDQMDDFITYLQKVKAEAGA